MRTRSQLAAWLVLTACSDDPTPLAAVAELCGEEGPVQILPLAPDEVVAEPFKTARFGDRWLYAVRQFEYPIVNVPQALLSRSVRGFDELDARIESIDRCGGDRRIVAQNVDVLVPPLADDHPWLGRRSETGRLYWIDPDGRFEPRLLAEDLSSIALIVRPHEAFILDGRDLLHATLAGDAAEIETFAEDVASYWPQSIDVVPSLPPPEAIVVLHDDGDFVSMDLSTGRTTAIARGVYRFAAEPTMRWFVLSMTSAPDEEEPPPAEEWLLDRQTGERWSLEFGEGTSTASVLAEGVVVSTQTEVLTTASGVEVDNISHTRFMALPSRASVLLEGEWELAAATTDQRRFAAAKIVHDGKHPPDEMYVFELIDGELQAVAGPLFLSSASGNLDKIACDAYPEFGSAGPCDYFTYSLETLQFELLGPRTWGHIGLPGDRWVVAEQADQPDAGPIPDSRVSLWVIDGATGDRSLLARQVSPLYYGLEPHEHDAVGVWRTDEIVYQVRETDTDRTGLWRARFE